ncbi:GNAT family N-acetyltransferase [Rhodobacterales bacterium HKCCSP123]|nr:GNAT family N-acetyltransferase [Rhodobacterales bacterium HKCCSP123]
MDARAPFRSGRLTGRPADQGDAGLYATLFGPDRGPSRQIADLQDWARHGVAPWVLSHAGHPVGVAGFRIGFGDDGLELSFHFLPEVAGQGLASEFVQAALDHAVLVLKEDRFFAFVPIDTPAPKRILEKAGFTADRVVTGEWLMRLSLPRPMARRPAPRAG